MLNGCFKQVALQSNLLLLIAIRQLSWFFEKERGWGNLDFLFQKQVPARILEFVYVKEKILRRRVVVARFQNSFENVPSVSFVFLSRGRCVGTPGCFVGHRPSHRRGLPRRWMRLARWVFPKWGPRSTKRKENKNVKTKHKTTTSFRHFFSNKLNSPHVIWYFLVSWRL